MKLSTLPKALALTIASISNVSAATYTIDFGSITGSYSNSLAVTDFLSISMPGGFFIDPTDIFGNPTPALTNANGTPVSFTFDTSRVNVSSLSLGGISNNAPVTIDVFGSINNTSLSTSNNWTETTNVSGLGNIAQFDLTLLESSVTFVQFEYDPVSAVPVPAAVWLFGSGLIGLIGVARRKS